MHVHSWYCLLHCPKQACLLQKGVLWFWFAGLCCYHRSITSLTSTCAVGRHIFTNPTPELIAHPKATGMENPKSSNAATANLHPSSTIKPWMFRPRHAMYLGENMWKGRPTEHGGPVASYVSKLSWAEAPSISTSLGGKNNHKLAVNQFPIKLAICIICICISMERGILILTFTSASMAVTSKRNSHKWEGCHRTHTIDIAVLQWISIFGTQSLSCQVTSCISLLQGTNWTCHWHLGKRTVCKRELLPTFCRLSHTKLYHLQAVYSWRVQKQNL